MRVPPLSLSALPGWSKLNNIEFFDTAVSSSEHQNGIILTREFSSSQKFNHPSLLEVPKDLILGKEFLLEMEKRDTQFKQLRELVGGASIRKDVMLFLLIQITIARNNTIKCTFCYENQIDCLGFETNGFGDGTGKCNQCAHSSRECIRSTIASHSEKNINIGVNNPWSEYVRFLPDKVPVPTMWNDQEMMLLAGTSLEHVVKAKISTLTREFEELREKTIKIPWCHSCWWGLSGPLLSLELSDWMLLDAWYRSRSLELPNAREVMIPFLDMANHSSESNAFWEQKSNGNVALFPRSDLQLKPGSEITINYGASKSDAEYLFQYGFIDESTKTTSVRLTVEPMTIDPLRTAKVAAFRNTPFIYIYGHEDGFISWESPFLYLMCLNEEDGLEFKTLQEVDGEHNSLRVFWQGTDVTESVENFETLIGQHKLVDVFKLRVAELLFSRIYHQLEVLYRSRSMPETSLNGADIAVDTRDQATKLREIETQVLEVALATVNEHKLDLEKTESVAKYFNSIAEESSDVLETSEEDDFS